MSKPTTHRPGSRTWLLKNMAPGDRLVLQAPAGRLSPFMQQISTDIHRIGCGADDYAQQHVIGVVVSDREVLDLVLVTRKARTSPEEPKP